MFSLLYLLYYIRKYIANSYSKNIIIFNIIYLIFNDESII